MKTEMLIKPVQLYRTALIWATICFAMPIAEARDLEKDKWIEVRSDNFTIRSVISRKATMVILEHLELLRATIIKITPTREGDIPVPDMIYVFNDFDELRDIGYISGSTNLQESDWVEKHGFVTDVESKTALIVYGRRPEWQSNNITMRPQWRNALLQYARFVNASTSQQAMPEWYLEGIANYLASAQIRLDNFETGVFNLFYMQMLKGEYLGPWLPIADLLTLSRAEHLSLRSNAEQIFHAQSWLFVHYLMSNPDNAYDFGVGMARYYALIDAGRDEVTAFEEAFAIPVDEIIFRLKKYMDQNFYANIVIPVDDLAPDIKADSSRLSVEEISLGLAQIAHYFGAVENAERWYSVALDDQSFRAAAERGLQELRQ